MHANESESDPGGKGEREQEARACIARHLAKDGRSEKRKASQKEQEETRSGIPLS